MPDHGPGAPGGVEMAPFNPLPDRYIAPQPGGQFLFYTVRYGGKPVAYSGMYLLPSMHTGLLIGREDTIYVEPEHRGRVGKALVRAILTDMQERGATQVLITRSATAGSQNCGSGWASGSSARS